MTDLIRIEGTDRRLRTLEPQIIHSISEVIASGKYLLGPRVDTLEKTIGKSWGASALATNSGTASLQIALMAANVKQGDEVIVPALTFASTAFAVQAVGATPVFVDVDPYTLTLDPQAAGAAIRHNTVAMIPVHLHGQMADMQPLMELATKHNLTIIEDCAQAHGATYQGKYAGSVGDFGCFSFYAGKNIGGLEDAGLVTFRDSRVEQRIRRLRDLGRTTERYLHQEWGLRARMGEFTAAVILEQMKYLEDWNQQRGEIAARYNAAFADLPIKLPTVASGRTHVYYKYTMRMPSALEREKLQRHLTEKGIETERIYPTLVPDQPAYTDGLPHRVEDLYVSKEAVEQLLCLPMYPELSEQELDRVIEAVQQYYGDVEQKYYGCVTITC